MTNENDAKILVTGKSRKRCTHEAVHHKRDIHHRKVLFEKPPDCENGKFIFHIGDIRQGVADGYLLDYHDMFVFIRRF